MNANYNLNIKENTKKIRNKYYQLKTEYQTYKKTNKYTRIEKNQ